MLIAKIPTLMTAMDFTVAAQAGDQAASDPRQAWIHRDPRLPLLAPNNCKPAVLPLQNGQNQFFTKESGGDR